MEKAARNLTPVTLELGGKSPCIVERSANWIWPQNGWCSANSSTAGQTCVAPDYLLIDRTVKDAFWPMCANGSPKCTARMPGQRRLCENGQSEAFRARVRSDRPAKVIIGGGSDPATLKIQPTVLDNVTPDDAVMQEEIFGPVLPVLTFDTIDEAENFVRDRPIPWRCICLQKIKPLRALFAARRLRRRLHQRHDHPPGHQRYGLWRRGPERHGVLPRQAEL